MINNRLTATDVRTANQIKESLGRALLGRVDSSVRIDNPLLQRYWVISFTPLRLSNPNTPSATRILALITSNKSGSGTEGIPHFAQLYGLTSGETRVLLQLLEQKSTQEIADSLSIEITTLRTHLSNLFTKTATKNQRELVKFYLSHPAISQNTA